jgi:hypothetical protein
VAQVVYIGDEATATGFRLAGVDARVASAELEHALLALAPLFAVIADVRGRGAPANLARTVRNALGID